MERTLHKVSGISSSQSMQPLCRGSAPVPLMYEIYAHCQLIESHLSSAYIISINRFGISFHSSTLHFPQGLGQNLAICFLYETHFIWKSSLSTAEWTLIRYKR